MEPWNKGENGGFNHEADWAGDSSLAFMGDVSNTTSWGPGGDVNQHI